MLKERDLSISKYDPSFLYNAHNIRLTAREDNTLLSITNERGTEDTNISFEGIPDINDVVMRINISSTLSMGELRKVASVLTMTAKTKQYGDTKGDIEIQGVNEAVHTDCLCEFFDTLCPMPDILREINRCIISDCEMADDASHALNSIRKQIKAKQAKISEKMAAILLQ